MPVLLTDPLELRQEGLLHQEQQPAARGPVV